MLSRAQGIATLAVIAAGIAVLGGVYGMSGASGNGANQACSGSEARAAALEGANVGAVAAMATVAAPRYLGDLVFRSREGAEQKLSDWKGRTVLLNLWATWCAPCREEMPALASLQKQMGGEHFEVVPVSIDMGSADKPLAFYREHGLDDLGFHHDGSMGVFNAVKKQGLAFGLPATMLIDPKGCVIGAMNGPADWASRDAINLVARATGG